MIKVNNSKRTLDEKTQLIDLVNHGQTYTQISNIIESENELVRKKIKQTNKNKNNINDYK